MCCAWRINSAGIYHIPSWSPAHLRAQMQIAITPLPGSLAQFVSHYGSAEVWRHQHGLFSLPGADRACWGVMRLFGDVVPVNAANSIPCQRQICPWCSHAGCESSIQHWGVRAQIVTDRKSIFKKPSFSTTCFWVLHAPCFSWAHLAVRLPGGCWTSQAPPSSSSHLSISTTWYLSHLDFHGDQILTWVRSGTNSHRTLPLPWVGRACALSSQIIWGSIPSIHCGRQRMWLCCSLALSASGMRFAAVFFKAVLLNKNIFFLFRSLFFPSL